MGIWKRTKEHFKKRREIYRSVTENEVIAMTLANDNKITSAALSTHTALSNMQARQKLTTMLSKGILIQKHDTSQGYATYYKLKYPELFKDLPKNSGSKIRTSKTEKELTDAEVIAAAVKAKGRLIPGILCINAQISIDQAKDKLQELQHKGVFDIEVTEAGGLIYLLNDFETYQQMMGDEGREKEDEGR